MKTVLITEDELDDLVTRCVTKVVREQFAAHKQISEPQQPAEYISRKEASKILGISLPTLHEHTVMGVVPAYRYGRNVRYKRKEVENLIKKINAGQ